MSTAWLWAYSFCWLLLFWSYKYAVLWSVLCTLPIACCIYLFIFRLTSPGYEKKKSCSTKLDWLIEEFIRRTLQRIRLAYSFMTVQIRWYKTSQLKGIIPNMTCVCRKKAARQAYRCRRRSARRVVSSSCYFLEKPFPQKGCWGSLWYMNDLEAIC